MLPGNPLCQILQVRVPAPLEKNCWIPVRIFSNSARPVSVSQEFPGFPGNPGKMNFRVNSENQLPTPTDDVVDFVWSVLWFPSRRSRPAGVWVLRAGGIYFPRISWESWESWENRFCRNFGSGWRKLFSQNLYRSARMITKYKNLTPRIPLPNLVHYFLEIIDCADLSSSIY